MSETDESARYLPRIREELDKLPLAPDQKAVIAPKILQMLRFLDTRAGRVDGGNLREDSRVFDFQSKINGVVERFAAEFAALKLTARDYVKAAVRQPQLFYQSPETVEGNITVVVERFAAEGLTRQDYVKAAVEQPSLFAQSPETVEGHISGVIERFAAEGLTRQDYVKAAVNQPSLFVQSPDTIEKNISGVVERFKAEGLTTKAYVQAALRQPQLFYQSPETIGGHIDLVFDLYDKGVFILPVPRGQAGRQNGHPHAPVLAFLLSQPKLLCLEDNNYVLRELHQRMTGADPSPKNLRRSRTQTEHELMRHLGHDDPSRPLPENGFIAGQAPPTEQQAKSFVLRALAREGYLKSAKFDR